MILAIGITWLAIAALAFRVEREIATRRHVKIFVVSLTGELQRLRCESLSTPGGLSKWTGGSSAHLCLECNVLFFDVMDADGYYQHRNADGTFHICPAGNDGPGFKFRDTPET